MAGRISGIAGEVTALIEPTVNELGYLLWDVEYVKEGATWYLRVTIDSPDGIDLDACEKVHRAIDPVLDEADPIEDAYMLEVSSPGIDRPLRTKEHFTRFSGEQVVVKTSSPIDGRSSFTGMLEGMEGDDVLVEIDGSRIAIDYSLIKRAHVVGAVDFS